MNMHPSEASLFQAAATLAAGERAAFLDRECAGDPALRARLEVLLAAHDQPDPLALTDSHTAGLDRILDPTSDAAVGRILGRY